MTLSKQINQYSKDAIFYIIDQYKEELSTISGKAKVIGEIAGMISLINPELARAGYINAVYKTLGVTKTELTKAINNVYAQEAEKNKDNEEAKLPDKYRKDFEEYGMYVEDSCYYFPNGTGYERGSNFIIKPLFHIYSKTDNKRLIQIVSNTGRKAILDLQSKGMVSLGNFQQAIFDEGNFLFEGTEKQFKRVLRKIGEEFPVANEVKTLGWQREGFYAFSNGIHTNKGYIPIDELGIVQHDDVKYFLPAFSSVYKKVRQDDDEYENERDFRFENGAMQDGNNITFKQWGEQMIKVFGENGKIAVAYFATALARDIIYDAFKYFPHLFLFGEKGSGKSYLAWRLNNIFFHGATGFNLTSGTNVGFYRKLAKTRNSISWFDEYSDGIHPMRFQALKAAFDGIGHEKGVMSQDNRTKSTKVNSALVISGQYLPTADDNALFTRSLLLSFAKITDRSEEDIKAAQLLEKWESAGLSGVLTDLLAIRSKVEAEYMNHHKMVQSKLKNAMPDGIESRIFNNYLVVLTMAHLLDVEGMLPMKYSEFEEQCINNIIEQNTKIQESESLATFWNMIEYLDQNNLIQEDVDYKYETGLSITLLDGRTNTKVTNFPKSKRLFHFQWSRIHALYMEKHRAQFGTSGLNRDSLKHYLHTNMAFIGITKQTKFGERRTSSYVFDADKLPFNLEREKQHPNEPVPSIPDEGQDDLPF